MHWQIYIYHPINFTATFFKTYESMSALSEDANGLHACGVDTEIHQVMNNGRRFKIAECHANESFRPLEEFYVPKVMQV